LVISMLTACRRCGLENYQGALFCGRCRSALQAATSYDLSVEDFVTDGDRRALGILKATGPILHLVHSMIVEPQLRRFNEKLSRRNVASRPNSLVESLATDCANTLGLDFLPMVYVGDIGQENAFTTGTDSKATVFIGQSLVDRLSIDELRALLGHEMGHIKSRHLVYHSVAEVLAQGMAFSTYAFGLGSISIPLRLALLAWQRESEFSADKASLIASASFTSVAAMFAKIVGVDEIINSDTGLSSILEAFQSHPNHLDRLRAVREFAESAEYSEIVRKLNQRKMFERAFSVTCRFCGGTKEVEETFCPSCGRSLV
jgi:Zn-dependent protease with chaperone function